VPLNPWKNHREPNRNHLTAFSTHCLVLQAKHVGFLWGWRWSGPLVASMSRLPLKGREAGWWRLDIEPTMRPMLLPALEDSSQLSNSSVYHRKGLVKHKLQRPSPHPLPRTLWFSALELKFAFLIHSPMLLLQSMDHTLRTMLGEPFIKVVLWLQSLSLNCLWYPGGNGEWLTMNQSPRPTADRNEACSLRWRQIYLGLHACRWDSIWITSHMEPGVPMVCTALQGSHKPETPLCDSFPTLLTWKVGFD
jgi:hypothetical protein